MQFVWLEKQLCMKRMFYHKWALCRGNSMSRVAIGCRPRNVADKLRSQGISLLIVVVISLLCIHAVLQTGSVQTYEPYVYLYSTVQPVTKDNTPSCSPQMTLREEHKVAFRKIKLPYKFLPNFRNPCWYQCHENETCNKQLSMVHTETCTGKTTTPQLKCFPFFYVIGTAKSGTSDFYQRLKRHPGIVHRHRKKENWFLQKSWFSRIEDTSDDVNLTYRLDSFIKKFRPSIKEVERVQSYTDKEYYHPLIIGDGHPLNFIYNEMKSFSKDPSCLTLACVFKWIHPQAKLIILMREPVNRLFSDYLSKLHKSLHPHLSQSKYVPGLAERFRRRFHQLAVEAVSKFKQCQQDHGTRWCAFQDHDDVRTEKQKFRSLLKLKLTRSMYSVYLAEWLREFPPEQIYLIRSEDYFHNQKEVLENAWRFLGLDPNTVGRQHWLDILKTLIFNAGKKKDKIHDMWPHTKAMLRWFYQPFNRELALMLHDRRYLWSDVIRKEAVEASAVTAIDAL